MNAKKPTILLVDDDVNVLQIYKEFFEQRNFITALAEDGSIAATRRGVNAILANRRARVCAGGSVFVNVGTGRKPPSDSCRAAAGQTG